MGINNFNQFLREKCPSIYEEIHLSEYAYKRISIDISLYMHKFKAVCGDRWLSAFVNLVACLRRNEIHCAFIFDGKAPIEKINEQAKRRKDREKLENNVFILEEALDEYHKTGIIDKCLQELYNRSKSPGRLLTKGKGIDINWITKKIEQKRNQLYTITPEDFNIAKELFDILKVPYYTAPTEAEKMCSMLCIDKKVCAVLSEDTDVIAYGTPVFLTKIDTSKDTAVRITQQDVLNGLEFNRESFLDFCIMCGTDYNSNVPKIGIKTAYKYISKHGTIENIIKDLNIDMSILKHTRTRELFTSIENYGVNNIPYCGRPEFEKLQSFVNKYNITINIEKLKKDFIHNVVVFESDDDVVEDDDDDDVVEDDDDDDVVEDKNK